MKKISLNRIWEKLQDTNRRNNKNVISSFVKRRIINEMFSEVEILIHDQIYDYIYDKIWEHFE